MLQNYFKLALRRILREKGFSLIHILGLSVSIASSLLLLHYISFELSYDKFHDNESGIYRVAFEQYENGVLKTSSAKNFVGLTSLIHDQLPEIKSYTAFDRTAVEASFQLQANGKDYYEPGSFYQTDSGFFKVFPSLLLSGNPSSVLRDVHNLVISEKIAKQLFGTSDPIGKRIENKSLSYSDVSEFIISGVMKDMPENSHFHLNFIAPNSHTDETATSNYWTGPNVWTYIALGKETNPKQIAGRLNQLIGKLAEENHNTKGVSVFLQPISDIHLRSNLLDELEPNGNEALLYILSAIGIIVLLLAWINYINIETARFMIRIKEVGIRRIIGSGKGHLTVQFLVEYLCIAFLASGLSAFLLRLILPSFTYLTGITIGAFQWSTPWVWILAISFFIAGSLIAGLYPAMLLAGINPIEIIKGKLGIIKGRAQIRKTMILVQLTSSLVLMAFLMVIYGQLDYMRLTNKKINLDKVISIRNPTVYSNDDDSINYTEFKAFENKILESHLIKNVTSSSAIPGQEIDEDFVNRLKRNANDVYDPTRFKLLFVDYSYVPFYDLKLLAGRNYSLEDGDEENWNRIILNESAIHALGFNAATESVGQEIDFHLWGDHFQKYTIVGVVEDYHQEAIKKAVHPTILSLNHSRFQQVYYSVKLNAGSNPQDALAYIETTWKELFPEKPFEFFFQDAYYDQQYKSELHFGRIFSVFTAVALFVACLGIFGMTVFEASMRMKEISIRKILGATITNVLVLLSGDYLRLVILSTVISIPFIYFFAHEWLMNYPERIELTVWNYVLPGTSIIILIALTSFIQNMKAANTNPLNNLKHE